MASNSNRAMKISRPIISVIGGLDVDLVMIANRIPDRGESVLANEYLEVLGGKGANSAIATYRTCHKRPTNFLQNEVLSEKAQPAMNDDSLDDIEVRMIGAIGDDRYGPLFVNELKRNGINTSGIVTVPNTRSSICFVMVENTTRENRCLFTLGATVSWKKEDFMKVENLGGGIVPDLVVAQMEINKETVEAMIETAGKGKVDFCLNAAPATPIITRLYRYITHLIVNESEAAIMSGRHRNEVNKNTWLTIANEFLIHGVANVVITLGAQGAFYATHSANGHCPGFKVKVVDTTGAGDTFTGAYASDYLRQKAKGEWDIQSAVVRSNKAAAMAIQSLSAQDGIPWSDELDDYKIET